MPYTLGAFDKEDVFVCRFIFARTAGGFCIHFEMSHAAGDGNTFYSILNQLSASQEIRPLEPKRELDFEKNVDSVFDSHNVGMPTLPELTPRGVGKRRVF